MSRLPSKIQPSRFNRTARRRSESAKANPAQMPKVSAQNSDQGDLKNSLRMKKFRDNKTVNNVEHDMLEVPNADGEVKTFMPMEPYYDESTGEYKLRITMKDRNKPRVYEVTLTEIPE